MVKMVKQNLNLLCAKNKDSRRVCTHINKQNTHEILFDNIEARIRDLILKKETSYVSCIVPYVSNRIFLNALSEKAGTRLITNLGPHLKSKIRNTQMSNLEKWDKVERSVVKTFSRGSGRNRTMIHSKIIIGYNTDKKAIWVTNGSWNATENAKNNIENIIIYKDPFFIAAFCNEFECLWEVSRHYNVKVHPNP